MSEKEVFDRFDERILSFDDLVNLFDEYKLGVIKSNEIFMKVKFTNCEFNFPSYGLIVFKVKITDHYILISYDTFILKVYRINHYAEITIK